MKSSIEDVVAGRKGKPGRSARLEKQFRAARRRRFFVEQLEDRRVLACTLSGALLPHVDPLWDADTPAAVFESFEETGCLGNPEYGPLPDVGAFTFDDANRWDDSVTDGSGLTQRQPTTLTWSLVPDGTNIDGFIGEPAGASDLLARLTAIYGEVTNDTNYQDEDWFPLIEQAFERWSNVTGLTYVYEPDDAFYNEVSTDTLRFRNVTAHEAGHGIGIQHVDPVNQTKLMESFFSDFYEGPQFDDILAGNRGSGDEYEAGGGNDTFANATDLGPIAGGQTVNIGTNAADTVVELDSSNTDFNSIDDSSDVNFLKFNVAGSSTVTVTLTPRGPRYLSGVQDGTPTNFNAKSQSDLSLTVPDTDGKTVLESADVGGLGASETLVNLNLPAAGTYFVRANGVANKAQFYQLDVAVTSVTSAAILGTVWNDTDGDGNLDADENGQSAVTLFLDQNGNGVLDTGETSTTSSASGDYAFDGLAAGTYTVAQVVPSGYTQTFPMLPVQALVDEVSQTQYESFHLAVESMGLGLYGGATYDQGSRDRNGTAGPGTLGNQETRLYLQDQFTAMGLNVSTQGTFLNVVGELTGSETPESIYIIGAHYDTTASDRPGGDDNASGTAGLLEAARVLSQYNFKSTIRFIGFNAEEDGLRGSTHYVNNQVIPNGENVLGMVNLDMILRPGFDGNPSATVDADLSTRTSHSASVAWAGAFRQAAADYVPGLVIDATTANVSGGSDHDPFVVNGYPAILASENTAQEIWGGSNAYYHTLNDASDRLANDSGSPSGLTYNYAFATNITQTAVGLIAQQAIFLPPGHEVTLGANDVVTGKDFGNLALGGSRIIGPINWGVAVDDAATGTGYLMYSAESVHTRFGDVHPSNADHLIGVRHNGTNWEYNTNRAWVAFTPIGSDVLLAEVDFSGDTVTGLAGTSDTAHGLVKGYASGDLVFTVNHWNGSFNPGEFGVTGTWFLPNDPPVGAITIGSINWGVAVDDAATGTGYLMYSAESVHTRFGDVHPSNADHLIGVRHNGTNWEYNTNRAWVAFTPIGSDVLLAEVDFSGDTVTGLAGTSDTAHGLVKGYASGDLVFTVNHWNGSFNPGEFGVTGTWFLPNDPPVGAITIGSINWGVAVDDAATGTGYLMYSAESVHTRFGDVHPSNADHLIGVRHNGTNWEYNTNRAWVAFTPIGSDVLLAEVDFSGDTVTGLAGTSDTAHGLVKGYASGDLVFTVNHWNGSFNPGEFGVTGTWFLPNDPPVGAITIGSINWGVAVDDAATGTGYLMYSAESVHTRFGDVHPSNADHLIGVRHNGTNWEYNTNRAWVAFTPIGSDVLLAEVDFSGDTVTGLAGTSDTAHGLVKGYASGDLVFTVNHWNGSFNPGEFGVTGTWFRQ